MSSLRRRAGLWSASVVALLTVSMLAVPTVSAQDTFEQVSPIEPISPIDSSIAPIAPIDPAGPSNVSSPGLSPQPPSSPRAPRLPRAPEVPVPAGVEQAQGEIDAIESGVASIAARISALGASDGQPLSELGSQEMIDALRDGRALFASDVPAVVPQLDADGCPVSAPDGTLRDGAAGIGVEALCAASVAQAPTPEAAEAVKWAFRQLGAPYACGGVGRMDEFRFDCSSLVSRAYFEGAGLSTASKTWAPTTRDLMPWDGVELAPWAEYVAPEDVRPGDLLLYRTCDAGKCAYQHVVMALADGYMLHTNRCGDVAHVARSWGTGPERNFEVARRVNPEKAR